MSGFEEGEDGDPTPPVSGEETVFSGFDGYAAATDPRDAYDDLLEESGEELYDEETFRDHATMEAYQSGWVATAFTLDDDDRVLLVYHEDHDHWMAPGGTLHPGETLREGLRREVREEAGVTVDPDRPHAVTEWIARNETAAPAEWTGFTVAFYEATLQTDAASVGTPSDPLGVDDEEITDADWFRTLPANTFNHEFTATVLDRIRGD